MKKATVGKRGLAYLAAVISVPAGAVEWSGYAGLATEYTDNSLQAPRDEQWDRSYIGSSGLTLDHRSGDFGAAANYNLTYTTFEKDTQSNETALTGTGEAHWYILPDTLTWDFEHRNTRSTQQAGSVDTTDTRSTQTVISTGPSSKLNITSRDSLQLSAHAMEVSTSGDVDNDSDRAIFSAALVHLVSEIQSLGLRATQQQVEYDGDVAPDVTFDQAALEWNRAYRAGRTQLSVGRNRAKRDELPATEGNLYQFYIDFNNVGHTFSFAAAQELTDSMLGLYQPGFAQAATQNGAVQSSFTPESGSLEVIDVIDINHFELNYSSVRLCERCQPSLMISYGEQDYEIEPLDQNETTGLIRFGYDLNDRLNLVLSTSHVKTEFVDANRTDITRLVSVGANYTLTEQFLLLSQLQWETRNSEGDLQDYEATTAQVGFQYLFGNRRP